MKKGFQKSILFFLFLCSLQMFGQSKTVTGEVKDPEGVPIPGVSVFAKNTSNGTETDFDGKFTIDLSDSENTILVFSYLGYAKQEIPVGNQSFFNITLLTDVQGLDEVVLVGYGNQKKRSVTGSVASVDTDVLASRPITDVARGLQGVTPGLTITTPSGQIGTNPTIKLRGNVGTLGTGGGAQPLILVDNVEIPSLQSINPEDIDEISVLKDAASTSIYGARGAWGVILITTKKGRRNQAPSISYSNNFSWATPTNTPKVAPAAEGAEMAFAAVNRRIPSLQSYGVVGMRIDQLAIEKMREWEELYGGQNLGNEMVEGRDYEIRDGSLFFYRSWDPREQFVEKWAPQQKHDFSLSGGSEKTNYYLGLGYLDQGGVYKTNPDKYQRYNVNLSVNSTINDWVDVRAKVLHSNSKTTEPFKFGSATYDAWFYTTRWPAFYPYGTVDGKPFRNHISEVEQAKMNETNYSLSRINLGTTLTPIKDLAINFDFTHDRVEEHEKQVGGTLYAYNFWGQGADFSYVPYSSSAYDRVQYNSDWSRRNTAKAYLNYDKEFNNHKFKFTFGGDMEEYEYWFHYSQRRELLNPDQGELALATGDQFVGGDRNKWTTLGFFGRVNYSYKDKLLLEVNARYDGSSRLSSDKKWGYFPSVSAGYVMTEEDFMKNLDPALSFLKFRGSYGSVGNQNTYLSSIYRIMSSTSSSWLIDGQNQLTVGTPGALPSSLTWETVTTLDFGLDAKFINNKLGLTFDWYRRTVSDMHSSGVTLPNTFGTSSPRRNFGEMQTNGWELALDFNHQFDNDLRINATATLSDFKEKITKYANDTKSIYSNYEGKVIGEIWGYETDRFFTEDDFNADGSYAAGVPSQELYETNGWFKYGPGDIKYKDINGDGVIDYGSNTVGDSGDMKVIGNTTPRYQYSIQLGADWKGFDLNMFMQGVGKRDFWANGPVFIPGYRYAEAWYDHQLDYWTPENTNAYYPRPNDQQQSNSQMNFLPQTKYLLNMSYLRMKNITLGYSLPESITNKLKVNKFRLYVSGENLFEISGVEIPVDPEVDYTNAGTNDTSTFGRVYPFRRSYSFGLQISL
ncbi:MULTISPECIES: SusC/RagA family TonB-linked outer membrane protein [Cellulophaga]|uniref:TonB-dependent receptor plug n=2 Tax=Cellulophaga TaxID=104264 RepID=F0RBW3_CELLC|nr:MULTISPECIES: TonB-dependent receptor [Cellulophaga]ADY28579.1 TonB-dependent receptor plug [Cellulophaga lytica DSM 7489]AIM59632.1 TonB-dependent receptor [Cellulophaga lytica]MDO6853882.1 TonB-dependent receptor [Cellulophaga lytica]WQG77243.1 TonB-dependent receptor [Cellulophaga lytica]SNQ44746.1 TonB-dependent receptor plug [Cellulophaga lytica]